MDHVFGKAGDSEVRSEPARFVQPRMIADYPAPPGVVIERVEVQRHLRPAMHGAVGLFVRGEAFFQHLHHAFARSLSNGAEFRAVERAGGAGADGFDGPEGHGFLTMRSIQSRSTLSNPPAV